MTTKTNMLSVAQALDHMLSRVRTLSATETVATTDALGRILASPQYSQLHVPPQDNTQMDGYAVRAADCASGHARLRISQRIPAGIVGQPLEPGTAARIFTGALIPQGADAVVMQEQCESEGDAVVIRHQPAAGEWIRRQGEDIRVGATILEAGTVLRAQEMGLAASVGLATLPVLRRPKVAIFFTGDELAMPGDTLRPGAIYNSNRYTLTGLLQGLGCDITDLGIVPDNLAATRAALRQAAEGHDLIITSGGVSVGEEDHVKPAVEAEGQLAMWQIAMKPGKPLAFGEVGSAFFIGLPGNPVSSFVTFLLFVRPFLLRLQGVSRVAPQTYSMRADFDWSKPDRRNEFLRARINADGGLDLFPNQSSGVLSSAVWGDGLIDLPPSQTVVLGQMVSFIPFSSLGVV
ncbi:molybdopterin molybdotransferase MoeA [Undibacterium curvum]|uniref:molybdopterin molybdotransferase MoeA n=1 Tax=Undibacterium curvum TaxID=2762294 RepID=UPI003D11F88E